MPGGTPKLRFLKLVAHDLVPDSFKTASALAKPAAPRVAQVEMKGNVNRSLRQAPACLKARPQS